MFVFLQMFEVVILFGASWYCGRSHARNKIARLEANVLAALSNMAQLQGEIDLLKSRTP